MDIGRSGKNPKSSLLRVQKYNNKSDRGKDSDRPSSFETRIKRAISNKISHHYEYCPAIRAYNGIVRIDSNGIRPQMVSGNVAKSEKEGGNMIGDSSSRDNHTKESIDNNDIEDELIESKNKKEEALNLIFRSDYRSSQKAKDKIKTYVQSMNNKNYVDVDVYNIKLVDLSSYKVFKKPENDDMHEYNQQIADGLKHYKKEEDTHEEVKDQTKG